MLLGSASIINPRLCNQLSILVVIDQSNNMQFPHLCVYLSKTTDEYCVRVRLDRAEYLDKSLDSKSKEKFLQVMTSAWPKQFIFSCKDNGEYRPANGYEAAVATWVETFGETASFNYDDDGYPIMPDYNLL